jgi:hypothetical protein
MIDDALKSSLQAFTDFLKLDTSRLPKQVNDLVQRIVAPVADAATVVQEVQVNLNDLIKLNSDTYIKASAERRKLWVDSAPTLPAECKADIQSQPVPVPCKSGGLAGDLNVLGSQGLRKLREWGDRSSQRISLQLQKQVLDHAVKQHNQAGKQQNQQPFRSQRPNNQQKKGQYKGNNPNNNNNNKPRGNASQGNQNQNKSNQKGGYKKKPYQNKQKS